MWGLIPMIKRELVLRLYKEHKLSKAFIAKKLEISKAQVHLIKGCASRKKRIRLDNISYNKVLKLLNPISL